MTPAEIIVREVRETDAGSIVELLNPIIRAGTYTIMDRQVTITDQLRFIRKFPERGLFLAAVTAGTQELMGIQDVVPLAPAPSLRHIGEISTFVALSAHRRGIGRRLSTEMFYRVPELGFTRLRAAIRADNPRAVAFYEKLGFETIGTARRQAREQGGYEDQVLMEKLLQT